MANNRIDLAGLRCSDALSSLKVLMRNTIDADSGCDDGLLPTRIFDLQS